MYFFFSSRRRHTRWNCDWSSDVCSSDLIPSGNVRESSPFGPFTDTLEPSMLTVTPSGTTRSEEHTSELQSQFHLVCRLLLEKKKMETASRNAHADASSRRTHPVDAPHIQ